MRGAYRDPELAADMLDKLIEKSGHDLRAAARTLERDGPEGLGTLRGREGWLAGRAAQAERGRARNAGSAIAGGLEREAAARDAGLLEHLAHVRGRQLDGKPGFSREAPCTRNLASTPVPGGDAQPAVAVGRITSAACCGSLPTGDGINSNFLQVLSDQIAHHESRRAMRRK